MREYDRCDQIRANALAFAVEFAGGAAAGTGAMPYPPEGVVGAAEVFHKFLLGGHPTMTKEEVVEMESVIRQDEAKPVQLTVVGSDPVSA
jgi:hypothetical protein